MEGRKGDHVQDLQSFDSDFTYKYVVVGSGFFGATLARHIAEELGNEVLIIEKRSHIGGASYSEKDSHSGIECHKYGSHIFHTRNSKVWNYVNRFAKFNDYRHKVFAYNNGKIYHFPINLTTINDVFETNMDPNEAKFFLENKCLQSFSGQPENMEEKALSMLGRELYDLFIYGYTTKHWACHPNQLPPEIFSRLPVRLDENTDYFDDTYQGIPIDGYGSLFRNLLDHPLIKIKTSTDFFKIKHLIPKHINVIFSGMIDELFDFKYGPLHWRSLTFEWQRLPIDDYQKNSVINYVGLDIPYTRVHEFKHYMPKQKDNFHGTVICREFPQKYRYGKEAFYPVHLKDDLKIYQLYKNEARKNSRLITGGRLGNFKYINMDTAIADAMECFETHIKAEK